MRRHVLALALVSVGGCFVDAGPGERGSGEATTGSVSVGTTGAAGTDPGTTGSETTVVTTGSETTGTTDGPTTSTTGSVSVGTTGVASTDPGTTGETTVGSTGDGTTGEPQVVCDGYYGTDFSTDPINAWQVYLPTWAWNKDLGLYRGSAQNNVVALARVKDGTWGDIRVRTRLRLVDKSMGGVLLRLGEPVLMQYLYIRLNGMTGAIEGLIGNTSQFSIGGAVSSGTWHVLDVSLIGKTLSFSLDGKQLANGIQIDGLVLGWVGLIAQTGTMEADVFYACPPE